MLHQRFGNTIVQLALQGADTALGSAVRGAMDAEVAGVRQEGGGPLLRHGRGSPAEIIRGLPSGGRPLPEAVRERFERAFDHDFSHVRVHTHRGGLRCKSISPGVTAGRSVPARGSALRSAGVVVGLESRCRITSPVSIDAVPPLPPPPT